jgi:hypothetical protein
MEALGRPKGRAMDAMVLAACVTVYHAFAAALRRISVPYPIRVLEAAPVFRWRGRAGEARAQNSGVPCVSYRIARVLHHGGQGRHGRWKV